MNARPSAIHVMAAVGASVALRAAAQQPTSPAEDRLASFEMSWPVREMGAVAARARSVGEVVTGRELKRPAVVRKPGEWKARGRVRLALPEAPELDVVYLPAYDEMRVVHRELLASVPAEREISQEDAVGLARKAFEGLAERGLASARQYAWERAEIASTWFGWGSAKDEKSSGRRRIEYRVTARRVLNGIEVANAGVRIAVHASGRISGVRLGGVAIASRLTGEIEEPTGKGRRLSRKLTDADLRARFAREVVPAGARAQVAWERVMYVMPENARSAVVAPQYVVSYALAVPAEDGATVVSRRKTVGLSLLDADAKPVDLTPPVRAPRPDGARKRGAPG